MKANTTALVTTALIVLAIFWWPSRPAVEELPLHDESAVSGDLTPDTGETSDAYRLSQPPPQKIPSEPSLEVQAYSLNNPDLKQFQAGEILYKGIDSRESPEELTATLLHAIQLGQVELIREIILLSPAHSKKIRDYLDSLPGDLSQPYDSSEHFVAQIMATGERMENVISLGTTRESADGSAQMLLSFESSTLGTTIQETLNFQNSSDGWQFVVSDSTINGILKALSAQPKK